MLSSISERIVEEVETPRASRQLIKTVEPTRKGPFCTAPSTRTGVGGGVSGAVGVGATGAAGAPLP